MSTMSQFFSGGGVPIQYSTNTSGSFTTPISGKYLITAIGGGGGSSTQRAGGGAGLAQSLVTLPSGVVLTLTVGAGGLASTAGGTTTVTGSGITTLTANGGAGGAGSGATAGGTASGGNIMNVTGGGVVNAYVTSAGGGAVGVYGTTPAASATVNGASAGGALVDIAHAGDSFLGGRLLQPLAGYFYYFDGNVTNSSAHPGQNGSGLFSGASFYSIIGGKFGGGGCQGGGGTVPLGGVGGVIIEYFLA